MEQDSSVDHPGDSPRPASLAEDPGRELRRILISGRVDDARIAGLLSSIKEGPAAETRSTLEALTWIVEGIHAVLGGDTPRGIAHLERAAAVTGGADGSLSWVALHWMARGALVQGELERAERAASQAVEMAGRISSEAHSLSLLALADIASLLERHDQALDHLRAAITVLREIQDDRGAATALLAMASTLHRLGRDDDGYQTALNARQADPSWPEPAVFLSERALADGDVERATDLVAPFLQQAPCPASVERQQGLIAGLRNGRYSALDVGDLLRLRERPLSAETVAELRMCQVEHPGFHQLRELLAWSLYRLGEVEEAEAHFKAMTSAPLDRQLRASVSLGLGCIASNRHKRPSTKVKAATGSYPQVPPITLDDAEEPARPARRRRTTSVESVDPEKVFQSLPMDSAPAAGPRRSSRLTSDAAFVGDLELFAVPDLLDFLQTSRRTGTLVITSDTGTTAVHMIRGRITGAAAPGTVSLGDLLIERGQLTREGLARGLEHQHEAPQPLLLGSILVELELVDSETLQRALVDQVKLVLLEAITWQQGRFAFEPDKDGVADEIAVDLDTRALLMDVLREFDEQNRDSIGA